MMDDSEMFTAKELREAHERLGNSTGHLSGYIDNLLKNICDHREPEWRQGDVVKDAKGIFYRRDLPGGSHPWVKFGNSGMIPDDWLQRPLKKLN